MTHMWVWVCVCALCVSGVCVCVLIPFIPPLAAARCLLQVAFIGGLTRWLVILNLDSNQAKSLAAGADVYTKIHFI